VLEQCGPQTSYRKRKLPSLQKWLKTTDTDGKDLMVVQTAVWGNRRKVLPPGPKKASDVYNAIGSVQHVTTNRGEKFLLQNDRENHMMIIGCESSLKQLDASDVILMDGTFEYCPKFFRPSLHHALCRE
jgi:hypothetical protein